LFGNKRSGDSDSLKAAANKGLFSYHAISAVRAMAPEREMTCSSSRIRAFLAEGDTASAAALLGRAYELAGRVSHGEKRGRSMGVPTANIIPPRSAFMPAYGVYAVRFCYGDAATYCGDETWHDGVANLGVRPSFGGTSPRLEVHGLDFNEDIYGKRMRVRLLHFLRGEQAFASVDALKMQISNDIKEARLWLNKNH
jgi:riboflavin kinase/FMN adenylyltransferase